MRLFISGPMTGIEGYNKDAFDLAEKILSDRGHTVLNPANHIPKHEPESISHDGYVRICKAMINECEAVVMLPGWEKSKGAREENEYAMAKCKVVCQDGDVNNAIKSLRAESDAYEAIADYGAIHVRPTAHIAISTANGDW